MFGTYFKAFQIGIIAGMRSMTAPALVSHKLSQTKPNPLDGSNFQFLTSPKTAATLAVLASGELVGDKLPNAPDRIGFPALSGRLATGALSGAALSELNGQSATYGATLGALGALAGSYAFFHLRIWLNHDKGIPDSLVALAEDVITVGAGWVIVNSPKTTPAVQS